MSFPCRTCIPQAREIAGQAEELGRTSESTAVTKVIDEILARPEHPWQAPAAKHTNAGFADPADGPEADGR